MTAYRVEQVAGESTLRVVAPGGRVVVVDDVVARRLAVDLLAAAGPERTTSPAVLDALPAQSVVRAADGLTWLAFDTPTKRRAWWRDSAVASSVGLVDAGPVTVLWRQPISTNYPSQPTHKGNP